MTGKNNLRLIIVFSVAFSLGILVGPSSGNFHLPTMQLAHANPQTCETRGSSGACSEFWYPAGPAMNTELAVIFTDATAELSNLQSASPSIDFTDSPLPPSLIGPLTTNPNFLVTAPVAQIGYYEIQFMLAQNFWGCRLDFGNSACGVQIRQGIAHMMDKTSFTNTEPSIAGISTAIDNPVPTTSAGGLPSPNPCSYDASFPQSSANCVVGAPGGTAYHLAAAAGADGFPWLMAPGSVDLNAAAQHFVTAGVATGFNSVTSVLTGISPAAALNSVNLFVRNDDTARLRLGQGLEAQICYLFTGSYTINCPYLFITSGPATSFPGFATSTTSVNLNWWMYTAAYSYVPFFDDSLYYSYNSRFVSGSPSIEPPNGPCSGQAVPTSSASDYMYLCSPNYDSLSSQMENAPCLSAPGDPASGASSNLPTPPGNGLCAGTSQLSAISAGIQAEANFGAGAFTIPIFERNIQFAYLNNGWVRAINDNEVGLPNHFTWLNAWNPTPVLPGTLRQGFSQTTRSANPYIASTGQDLYILQNVYDSLHIANPLNHAQSIDWMSVFTQQLSNSSLSYTAPAHTLTTYGFALRTDLFFQDGRPVTAYDVAFSYLSMVGTGSFLGTTAAPITGITIRGPHQLDIGVNSLGSFVLPNLTVIPIVPGRYWTNAGSSSWDRAVAACTTGAGCANVQYTLTGAAVNCSLSCNPSASLMTVNPFDTAATFDPIAAHIFVGSGPWTCGTVTSVGSGTCTSTGQQNPPPGGSYTLTRFGIGHAPGSNISDTYFRSSGTLALWVWSEMGGQFPSDFALFSQVAFCYNAPVNLTSPCGHWQQGIGGNVGGSPSPVDVVDVSIVARFLNVNWVSPSNWATAPPTGIGVFPPVLYEGTATLNPASIAGCPGGYNC